MKDFLKTIETFWNHNQVIAWLLVIVTLGLVIWSKVQAKSPGVAIGLLALAAVVMSVRPEMRPAEKFAWVLLLISFTLVEFQAITKSDERNEAVRNAQNLKFEAIVQDLKLATEASKSEYSSTIKHVDKVLTTTREVANLSKDNLAAIQGGDSFFYFLVVGNETGAVLTKGRNNIRTAQLKVLDVYEYRAFLQKLSERKIISTDEMLKTDDELRKSYSFSDLPPNVIHTFPIPNVQIHGDEIRYFAFPSALNGRLYETYIRKRLIDGRWVEAIRLVKDDGPKKGLVLFQKADKDFPREPDGAVLWQLPGGSNISLKPLP